MGTPEEPAGKLARLRCLLDAAFTEPGALAGMAGEIATNQQLQRVLHDLVSAFWPPQRRTDFALAGAMKAGTTALNWFLSEHPQVCTALAKEAHYFDYGAFFERGEPNDDWYHAFFAHGAERPVAGEATPTYLCDPSALQRLAGETEKREGLLGWDLGDWR